MCNLKVVDITFDSDGPLADTILEVLRLYNNEYGLDIKKEDIKQWDLTKVQEPGTDMCKYFSKPGFFRHLNPVENSQKVVHMLSSQGHELFVATASPTQGLIDKKLWAMENYPSIPEKNISLIERKDKLTGKIILDDGLHNLKNSKFEFPILFDEPWNQDGADGLVRVYDWMDFFNVVQKISAGCTYDELLAGRRNLNKAV